MQLLPPDAASNAQGPTEIYFVQGVDAEGITQASDPQVVQFLDQQLTQLAPFLKRAGQPEALQAGAAAGIALTWEGQNPQGMAVRARVFAVILKGYAVGLVALGERDRIQARDAALRQMFATFGFGEGAKDPHLVGSWRYEKHYFSGEFSSTTMRYLTLRPDGTFTRGSRLLASTSGMSADTGDDPGESGRWAAANQKLYLMWDDGSYAEYGYSIEGQAGARNMLLKPADGKHELWEEVR